MQGVVGEADAWLMLMYHASLAVCYWASWWLSLSIQQRAAALVVIRPQHAVLAVKLMEAVALCPELLHPLVVDAAQRRHHAQASRHATHAVQQG